MQESEQNPTDSSTEVPLVAILSALWARKILIALTVAVFCLVGVGVALIWPPSYEASATVLPVTNSGSSGSSETSALASLTGLNLSSLSGSSSVKTINALLASRLLVETLVRDLGLVERTKAPGDTEDARFDATVGSVMRRIKTREDTKTGVITVTFEDRDPELAQEVANKVVAVLDRLLSVKSLTSNQKRGDLLVKQVEDQAQKVTELQRRMAEFQTETTLLSPVDQAAKIIDSYTELVTKKMDLQLQLATGAASYSPENPRMKLLRSEIASLETQIQASKHQVDGELPSLKMAPDSLLRYQNLFRDLEISTKIYEGLLASLEQVKLEMNKDQMYIEVLDPALLPLSSRTSKPLILVFFGFLGTVAGCVAALVLEFRRRREGLVAGGPS